MKNDELEFMFDLRKKFVDFIETLNPNTPLNVRYELGGFTMLFQLEGKDYHITLVPMETWLNTKLISKDEYDKLNKELENV